MSKVLWNIAYILSVLYLILTRHWILLIGATIVGIILGYGQYYWRKKHAPIPTPGEGSTATQ